MFAAALLSRKIGGMEAPAFWTIPPQADHEGERALIECVAQRLGIPTPPTDGGSVALPPHPGAVVDALDACDPDWHRKGLLLPP